MICKSCKDYCLSGFIQVERSSHKEFYCYAGTARLSTIKAERQKSATNARNGIAKSSSIVCGRPGMLSDQKMYDDPRAAPNALLAEQARIKRMEADRSREYRQRRARGKLYPQITRDQARNVRTADGPPAVLVYALSRAGRASS